MNILFLNTTYQCGGAERVVSQLFQGMRQRGHQVYQIVSYDTQNSKLPPNIHVLYSSLFMRLFNRLITRNHSNESLHIWYSRRYIEHFVRKHRIDLIHLHNPHDNFLGILDIAALAGLCPVVWTLHDFWAMTGHCTYPHGCEDLWQKGCPSCHCLGSYPAIRRDTAHQLFLAKQQAFQEAKITFTVPSEWMKKQFERSHLQGHSCRRIYNGLDTSLWKCLDKQKLRQKYGIEKSRHLLAFIAADPGKELKGMDTLSKALSQLPDPEDFLLLIAGKECSFADSLPSAFQIRHFGYLASQQKLNEFYALADLLVNPSSYETFGLTTIEAMASGTPVLAFPVCAMPEIIDESCGWIAAKSSAQALAEGIRAAFKNPEALALKGQASRRKAEKFFDEKEMLTQFERLYDSTKNND